jgi:hypothetical protein
VSGQHTPRAVTRRTKDEIPPLAEEYDPVIRVTDPPDWLVVTLGSILALGVTGLGACLLVWILAPLL